MASKTVLTGVKPTGTPHIGNLIGAIRPALKMANATDGQCLFFIADYHALTTIHDPAEMRKLTREVAATWLAFGLDPNKVLLYRQSDVPEVFELSWVLSCFAAKGLLNRAHAYKAAVDQNVEKGKDPDKEIFMGLYCYPVLMAADILCFDADEVPVGEDQVQHLEIARDIAQKFNHTYGEVLRVPKATVQEEGAYVPGLDGRKMSKSYDNTIPLSADTKRLRKLVMKIQTDSSAPEDPKDPENSSLFSLYKLFAKPDQVATLRERYQSGIGWGEAKQLLFEAIEAEVESPRKIYEELLAHPEQIETILAQGALRAREKAGAVMERVRQATGIANP
ncbi:MAG: tryptophan--tRNA ligase [Bdellovibrionaceae bacterium]|nr:tryptophan--tRNA ligase [Pseudobdellovibrionaceae bacterium]